MLTKSDLSSIQKIVDGSIQRETEPIKKDVINIKLRLRCLNKTVDAVINHFADITPLCAQTSFLRRQESN